MTRSISGQFGTRRAAEMVVERLVQEFGVERTAIFIAAAGDENSAGTEPAGADEVSADPRVPSRADGAYEGTIDVSVGLADDDVVEQLLSAFEEFRATDLTEE